MTVASNTPYDQYLASNGQTVFNYTFEIVEDTDLLVYQTPDGDSPNDVTQVLVFNVDYTVTGAGNENGGTVVLNVGAALNDVITIKQNIPVQRDTSFTPGGVLRAQDLNTEFDNQTLIQQVTRFNEETRTIRYRDTEILTPFTDTIIPKLGAQQVWRMSEAGDEIEAFTIDGIPAPSNSYFLTWGADPSLENEQNLGALSNGLLKQTVSGGFATLANAIPATDYWAPGNALTRTQAPVVGDDVTNKTYVDSLASGFSFVTPATVATTANLSATYDNGVSGVGATLTAVANGAANIDGVALLFNDRVLFKNQTATEENGIYVVTTVGDGSTQAVFTRSSDFDEPSDIVPGILVPILEGTVNQFTLWLQTSDVTTIGTDPIVFVEFGISATNIVTIAGNQTITGEKTFSADVELDNNATLTLNATTSVDEILDEDNMASDSATALASQQSIKAYADQVGGFRSVQVFTANGTWTKPSGIKKIIAYVIGGGGGGGYSAPTAGQAMVGSGGASGSVGIGMIDVTAIASESVTVGAAGVGGVASTTTNATAGGTSSFGAHITAPGGGAGTQTNSGAGNNMVSGGTYGSAATGGSIANWRGQPGAPAQRISDLIYTAGNGAMSLFGSGGQGIATDAGAAAAGGTGSEYGAGGGGGANRNGSIADGGAGAPGVVIVYEYA